MFLLYFYTIVRSIILSKISGLIQYFSQKEDKVEEVLPYVVDVWSGSTDLLLCLIKVNPKRPFNSYVLP